MQVSVIRQEAQRLKAKYHTDNPYDICREMRIRVIRTSMGTQPESCKGFFVIKNRCKVIALNCDLPENIQRIILVHELAHANLHSGTAISAFHEFQFFDNANIMEYEANVFAAEFLLSDEDVLDALENQLDFFGTASLLNVPPELLSFKIRILQRQGYEIESPIIAKSDFLRRDISKPTS